MSYVFRPAVREQTPVIVGLAGPSKSGKTYSALRMAIGMANGGKIAMINTEGPRGHQYADKFKYDACDLNEPFSMKNYEEAIKAAAKFDPIVLIIDSMSHAHEGIGGMLDQHEAQLDKMCGNDFNKRQKMTFAAWAKPKADEAQMINTMLQQKFHIILCFRAKEKLKIISGKEPKNLGWRPIASDRIHYETAVTLILPPSSKGKPDLTEKGSELREPFDSMIENVQINEGLGKKIAEWASGGEKREEPKQEVKPENESSTEPPVNQTLEERLSGCENVEQVKVVWGEINTALEAEVITAGTYEILKKIKNTKKKQFESKTK